jgi:hypothetical protein
MSKVTIVHHTFVIPNNNYVKGSSCYYLGFIYSIMSTLVTILPSIQQQLSCTLFQLGILHQGINEISFFFLLLFCSGQVGSGSRSAVSGGIDIGLRTKYAGARERKREREREGEKIRRQSLEGEGRKEVPHGRG